MPDVLRNRFDFVLLFDVADGNPNGDPDAGNLPRFDPETGEGIVTDVCLKRKVRNFVELVHGGKPPHGIYIKEKAILNRTHQEAYDALELDSKKPSVETVAKVRNRMCENFYDVRTFGAVMSTKVNAGQVRGPVQFTFGRSVGPVVSLEHTITRMAVTDEGEAQQDDESRLRTMGRKSTIPYGLYRAHGFVSAPQAQSTGFNREDLDLLWRALAEMFEHDRSAARGLMSTRGLYAFEHDSELGSAPAHKLFDSVRIDRNGDDDEEGPARGFGSFSVVIDPDDDLPPGVTLHRLAE